MSAKKRGRPVADIDGLTNAAIWLLYLDPHAIRVKFLSDAAALLLDSEVHAVQRVVGSAGFKTLRNRLAPRRHAVLTPEWPAVAAAILWAEQAGLPLIPIKEIAALPQAGVLASAFQRLEPSERDLWTMASALSARKRELPADALQALRRFRLGLLGRLLQLAGDD